jgi:hypothetical protein
VNSTKPLVVGSQIVFVAHFLNDGSTTCTVKSLVPGEQFVMATAEPFRWNHVQLGGHRERRHADVAAAASPRDSRG